MTNSITAVEFETEEEVYINDNSINALEIIEKMEQSILKKATLHCQNIEITLKKLQSKMRLVQAAGGLVFTPDNEILLIFRKGKWDLPKGKLDKGEDLATCALREITEETGAEALELIRPLTITYHTYHEKKEHILKESHWYLVSTTIKSILHPQIEEDITESRWVPIKEIEQFKLNMHASVRDVIDAGMKFLKPV